MLGKRCDASDVGLETVGIDVTVQLIRVQFTVRFGQFHCFVHIFSNLTIYLFQLVRGDQFVFDDFLLKNEKH